MSFLVSCKGPNGRTMYLSELPGPLGPVRWTPARKALLLHAIRGGILPEYEARLRYGLSSDELEYWGKVYDRLGLDGLKSTKAQLKDLKEMRGARSA